MHPKRVVIARVAAVIVAIIAAVVVDAAVGAFGSLLLGHLFPIIQVIVILTGGRPRARATIIRIVIPPIVFRLGRLSVFWTGNLLRGVPEVDECGLTEIGNSKEETRGTQFRQVRAARCVIPYVLYAA
jgi:hypothetical protein